MITFLKTMDSMCTAAKNTRLSPMKHEHQDKSALDKGDRKSPACKGTGCRFPWALCRADRDSVVQSTDRKSFSPVLPVVPAIESTEPSPDDWTVRPVPQLQHEHPEWSPFWDIVGELLRADSCDVILTHLSDTVICLRNVMEKLQGSSTDLDRAKVQLACERLQLLAAIQDLRRNAKLKKAVKTELKATKARLDVVNAKGVSELEVRLKEADSKLFRKYTDMKSSSEAKSLLSKAKAKLESYDTFQVLVSRRREELLKKHRKKDDKHSSDRKPKHVSHGLRRTEPLGVALRSRRQQGIVESMRHMAERGRIASVLRRLETDV